MATFTVVDNRSNQIKEYESTATTFGELRAELTQQGFDLTDTEIQEGLTKTILSNDDRGLLPRDVHYRGTVTNNLIFRITQAKSKTKSGMTREEAYKTIKNNNWGDLVAAKLGKSYTNCKTKDLQETIAQIASSLKKGYDDCMCKKSNSEMIDKLIYAVRVITELLYDRNLISLKDYNQILDIFKEEDNTPLYTEDEINEIFEDM